MGHVVNEQPSKSVDNHHLDTYNISYQALLQSISNYTKSETKPPKLKVRNEPEHRKGKILQTDLIVTIFIHGYKGNEYDLSKVKSYLTVLFGYHNFYSIKGLSSD